MSEIIYLHPWEQRVSRGYASVELRGIDQQVVVRGLTSVNDKQPPVGFFAVYEDEIFAVFLRPDSASDVSILMSGRIWSLTPDVRIVWRHPAESGRWSRSIEISDEKDRAKLNYHTFRWNIAHRPVYAICNVLFADEWWGVLCDLPSWVETHWNAKDLLPTLRRMLAQGHDK